MTDQSPDSAPEPAVESVPSAPVQPETVAPPVAQTVDAESRRRALANAVAAEVAGGARVESQTDTSAIVVTGKKVNHLLQLVITLVTCGLWLFVWAYLAIVKKEHRISLQVDEFGNVLRQQLT